MAIGLAIPVGVNAQGRAKTADRSDFIKQTVLTAIRDCQSRNPFQDLGIDETIIFDINDKITVARIKMRIVEIFSRFEAEALAKLDHGAAERPLHFEQTAEGELDVHIKYVDLETNRPKDIGLSLPTDFGA